MYDWWVLQLAKLSVSRKLMVGFGVLSRCFCWW